MIVSGDMSRLYRRKLEMISKNKKKIFKIIILQFK